jgi:hypothetical protein
MLLLEAGLQTPSNATFVQANLTVSTRRPKHMGLFMVQVHVGDRFLVGRPAKRADLPGSS